MSQHYRFEFVFDRTYEIKLLSGAPPLHPVEKLHQFPVELEEGDRAGAYVRVTPKEKPAWTGFFSLGFDSDQAINAICSCPDPDSLCVIVGGYAYVVEANDPAKWFRIEQHPVTHMRILSETRLMLFAGFTSITALGATGTAWTTGRLSWEGISITEIEGDRLYGLGWDAIVDKEVPFEVNLKTGKHLGGASPGINRS